MPDRIKIDSCEVAAARSRCETLTRGCFVGSGLVPLPGDSLPLLAAGTARMNGAIVSDDVDMSVMGRKS